MKRLVIMLWVLVAGILLWLMNKTDMQSNELASFFRFVSFLFICGFVFQVLYDMATAPANAASRDHWEQLGKELSIVAIVILGFIGMVHFEAHVMNCWFVPSLGMFAVVVSKAIKHGERVHRVAKEIHRIEEHANKALQSDGLDCAPLRQGRA
jgi:hypothetical protein